jgi:hypothetical protein
MKLRCNELCPIHRSVSCCGVMWWPRRSSSDWAYSVSKIRITQGEIEIFAHRPRCGN